MKRTVAFILCLALCVSMLTMFASARDVSHENAVAEELKVLNLFKGVSETNFDLDRAPTRIEALVMLIRVLGKENEALSGSWSHPFRDVPQWADKYVGYAYTNKLTNGVSATEFGSGNASSAMYLTFVLRALGYSDANGKDFTWDNPYELGNSCGILPVSVDIKNFLRADVALISHAALECAIKGQNAKLSEKLIREGVFSAEQYSDNYDMFKHTVPSDKYDAFNALKMFVIANGEYIKSELYGMNTDSYMTHFVNQDAATEFDIEYIISTAALRITETRYMSDRSYFKVTVVLNSENALSDGMKVFGELVDGSEKLSGIGTVIPETFRENTPFTYSLWPEWQHGSAYTKKDCEDATATILASMLDILQSVCRTYNVPVTVADLGFESIF
ncbi:MAG: hypothetical protein IJP38_09450 [Oscillospiraceae bacterium]|nr:hypothetical protein [Oscillospiraceae bacterium]